MPTVELTRFTFMLSPDSSALAKQCSALQSRGPLLVVASSRTVSEFALSWEATLQSLDIPYRVFVFSEYSSHEIDEILAEAIDFRATALAVIGNQRVLNVAKEAASQADLPLVSVLYEPR